MLDLIKETGLSFSQGQKLTSQSMNIINDSLNSLIKTVNTLLTEKVDINLEEGTNEVYTLKEAIDKVPAKRRVKGVEVRFLGITGKVESYTYKGGSWEDLGSWESTEIIDGGEW